MIRTTPDGQLIRDVTDAAVRVTTTGAETIDVRASTTASSVDFNGRSLRFLKVTNIP